MRLPTSLATKSLLVFGTAIALSLLAASLAPLVRMNAIVDEGQQELSRRMIAVWDRLDRQASGGELRWTQEVKAAEYAGIPARRFSVEQARNAAKDDPFLAGALDEFIRNPRQDEVHSARRGLTSFEYRSVHAVRSGIGDDTVLQGVILLDRRSFEASRLLMVNIAYLLLAGTAIVAFSLTAFYFIADRLILRPVRALTSTAEKVREGDLSIRSEIQTGDEFERLSETFNSMLGDLHSTQNQLRSINQALDTKLNELAEANVALYEAAKLKGEFLANISHELRTPLNSIIGFAELLLEIARAEATTAMAGGEHAASTQKRIRYLENMVIASRGLLELINGLLEMARLEAGKIDLRIEKVSLRDSCQGLLGLIAPLADKKGITLKLELADDLPIVETDPTKFQQIVFNLLSNAVKFTESPERSGRPGLVTLRAERIVSAQAGGDVDRVRISVIDTGPGIPPEEQERIFEKFHQLDSGHTREHAGTGLGLAITKELAGILQGDVTVFSEPGRGSMFSVILPVKMDPDLATEIQLEARFRGKVARRRTWF
ncbi:MAG: HAMP domain-containing protein [Phycisphaerales bacterium]|nr:HAMP domain-containing protein [Phycisphaerales bacterium]